MKNLISIGLTLLCLCFVINLSAQQMGVNTSSPDPQAILDVTSSNKGLLIPRMPTSTRPAGVDGLMIYNSNTEKFNFFENNEWIDTPFPWKVTSAGYPYVFTPRVGIGTVDPQFKLHVSTTSSSLFMLNRTTSGGTSTMTFQNPAGAMTLGMASDGDFIVGKSTTINDDLLRIEDTGNAGELEVKEQVGGIVPCGGIIMWNGNTLPEGWVLCNGSNGTPNMVDRFVYGRQISTTGATGGANVTTITLTEDHLPTHNHDAGTLLASSVNSDHSHEVKIPKKQGVGSAKHAVAWTDNDPEETKSYDSEFDGEHEHTITGNTGDTGLGTAIDIPVLPRHYTLAFIMKKCD